MPQVFGFIIDPQWVKKGHGHKALLCFMMSAKFCIMEQHGNRSFTRNIFGVWLIGCILATLLDLRNISIINPIKDITVTLKITSPWTKTETNNSQKYVCVCSLQITCILRSFKFVRQLRFCQQRISTDQIYLISNWTNNMWWSLMLANFMRIVKARGFTNVFSRKATGFTGYKTIWTELF